MRCAAAGDGDTALEHGRSFAPDLVILDLGLPRVDGIEVARTLREDDDVPILILTARDAWSRAWRALTRAPTTIWSSPSSARSCWRGCARCCAGARRAARRR